jgi:hypothetical protein
MAVSNAWGWRTSGRLGAAKETVEAMLRAGKTKQQVWDAISETLAKIKQDLQGENNE